MLAAWWVARASGECQRWTATCKKFYSMIVILIMIYHCVDSPCAVPWNAKFCTIPNDEHGLGSWATLNPTYEFFSNVHGPSQQSCPTNRFIITLLHERLSMVHYKLQLTYGRWSHCNSPKVSCYYYLHAPNVFHKYELCTRDFFPTRWSSAMQMAISPSSQKYWGGVAMPAIVAILQQYLIMGIATMLL